MPDGQSGATDDIQFPQANITAVNAIAGILRTTIGPTPRDKLVLEQLGSQEQTNHAMVPGVDEVTVAADGERILEALPLEHPVAPVVHRMVGPERPGETDVVGERITDGVSSTVALAASLLSHGESLVEKGVHPTSVATGYQSALAEAVDTLDAQTTPLRTRDEVQDVARTAMTGNDIGGLGDTWEDVAVEAANAIGRPTERSLVVRASENGSVADSHLVHGGVLDRNERANDRMPTRIEDATVLLVGGTTPGGLTDPSLRAGEPTVTSADPAAVERFDAVHDDQRAQTVARLVDLGVDVVATHQGISEAYQEQLVAHDIMGIRGVNTLDIRQLALATGATVVLDPTDIDASDLGTAGVVEETEMRTAGSGSRQRGIVFSECDDPESVAAVLRGVRGSMAEYAKVELRKAVAAIAAARRGGVVPGGGAVEMAIAGDVRSSASSYDDREQLAVDAFADALEEIPRTLVRNGGSDPVDTMAELRARHAAGDADTGFIWPAAAPGNAQHAGVLDPAAVRRDVYVTATEVANLVLKVDDAIDATFEDDEPNTDDVLYDDEAEKQEEFLETGEL